MARRLLLLILVVVLGACSSSDGSTGKTKPTGALHFEPDAQPAGSSVTLRAKELTADRLVLEVVGHSLTKLYGVAFRLKLDPAVLALSKLEASSPIALASEKTPGVIVATITQKGKAEGLSGSEVVLGTLTLSLAAQKPTTIELVKDRCTAVTADGRADSSLGWAGGKLVQD